MEVQVSTRAAVLVIDVQCALFDTNPPPLEGDAVIRRINDLTARARRAHVPIYFVQHDGSEEDGVVPMTPGWRLRPDLEHYPQDHLLRKTTCDAFFQTSLETQLRSERVESLVVVGYATEFCIDSTVRSACSKGFRVYVGADTHTTNDNPVLKASQVRDHHNWAWAHCTAKPAITVAKTAELRFENPGSL